jgi:hypothetical protein
VGVQAVNGEVSASEGRMAGGTRGRLAWFAPWFLYWVAKQISADILSCFVPLLVGGSVVVFLVWAEQRCVTNE